jgi:hypothetical protein
METKLTKKELLEIFPEARVYLENEKQNCLLWIDAFTNIIKYELKKIKNDRWFWEDVIEITTGAILEKWEKRLKTINLFLTSDVKNSKLTADDIARAKEYPFENLVKPVKIYKRGHFLAFCPFHTERHPSFVVKNNYGHCFGACGKGWDTIQYLIEKEEIKFTEAVKRLI